MNAQKSASAPAPGRPWRDIQIPLLVYHNIHSDSRSNGRSNYSLSVEQFERHMRYLHEGGYRCLSLSAYLKSDFDGIQPSRKAFVLTFDDGYEDFFINAFPILSRYDFTATVFLVTDQVGHRNVWDGPSGPSLMTWEQIETLRKEGITFGSHTCNHPRLLTLAEDDIWLELTASRQRLETRLAEPVKFLAYPYGESNRRIQQMAQQAGYEAACGVITGRNDKYNLWRTSFEARDSMETFVFRLTPWYNHLMKFRRWVREDTSLGKGMRSIKHR